MKKLSAIVFLCALAAAVGCTGPKGVTVHEKRSSVRQMRRETLGDLCAREPELKERIRNASGYGVFSNVGTNIILVTAGNGFGIVTDNRTGEETYMRMATFGLGLGLGVKDFRALFIFNSDQVLSDFVEKGWAFGAEADAVAKSGEKGGGSGTARALGSDIEVYQLTRTGIALQASVAGTKYWKDEELNE